MSEVFWIDSTVQIVKNDDGTWSVTYNGDETSGLDYETAMKYALEFVLTDDDIDAWHNGDGMTEQLLNVWQKFPSRNVFQIWGGSDSPEPLNVTVTGEVIA